MLARGLLRGLKRQVKLFTPGTVNTSVSVKQALMYDHSDQLQDFRDMVADTRKRLLALVKASYLDYATIFLPGPENYALEAALGSAFPRVISPEDPKSMLIISNGVSGERMVQICDYLEIPYIVLRFGESEPYTAAEVLEMLRRRPTISHVAAVHSEITTGLLNPITEIGELLHDYNPDITFIVDAINSIGAVGLDVYKARAGFVVGSPNKCMQGVPGLAFVLANIEKLRVCRNQARSYTLDLWALWDYQLKHPGEFSSLPPTHVLAAFHQALIELEQEGGVEARQQRYTANQHYLQQALQALGFTLFLDPTNQGPGVTVVLEPKHRNYHYSRKSHTDLYEYLSKHGVLIYPGRLKHVPSFRIATIGDLTIEDVKGLVQRIQEAFEEMQIPLPLKSLHK